MFKQYDCDSWRELEVRLLELQDSTAGPGAHSHSQLLFRGQASYGWSLETTLERAANLQPLAEYYRLAGVAQQEIESFMPRNWGDIDYARLQDQFSRYESLRGNALPHYEYLVYLRHHGFPSPLLDWTRSPYVAAFFAFERPMSERVAIWAYQEHAGNGKLQSSDQGQIHTIGPNIRTHPRHFLQQAEYTAALKFEEKSWHIVNHEDVFFGNSEDQDHLWKFTAPRTEARAVLNQLDKYNINAYSLFQTEDALLSTLASRLIARGEFGLP